MSGSAVDLPANPLMVKVEGPAPAMEVALDIVKRGLFWLPALVIAAAIGWAGKGAASAAYAVAIVLVNFFLSAWLLQTAGRISAAAMAGAAFFGFILRLGLIFLAVMLVRNAPWVELVPLGLVLIITHLGLLFWELRYVSGSLAYPGLKPSARRTSTADAG